MQNHQQAERLKVFNNKHLLKKLSSLSPTPEEETNEILLISNSDRTHQIVSRALSSNFLTCAYLTEENAFKYLKKKNVSGIICDSRHFKNLKSFILQVRKIENLYTTPLVILVDNLDAEDKLNLLLVGADTVCPISNLEQELSKQLGILFDW
jgi:PleD family two-component response regulator